MRALHVAALGLLFAAFSWGGISDADSRSDFQRPLEIPFPSDAPYSPLIATLGKMLYFDPRISGAQNMSCASCHNPSFGWEVPVERAVGAQNTELKRHAPTILNLAWVEPFFWDGRARTLEEQALGPITADVEMNAPVEDIVDRLSEIDVYRYGFQRAFPDDGLSQETILTAIATYERTVVSGWSPFDRWVEGEEDAISDSAKHGFELFVGRARCASCHTGWNMTDNQFHDIGLATEDLGRAEQEPDNEMARHAFKTPGLRNIAHRSPYGHNGSVYDLEELIRHYMTGGIQRPSLSPNMQPLDLNESEVTDLIAFLNTLTADEAAVPTPILPTN
ncbi:MAG: cytochrome c peroxidase [Pseudomonadota bacterium]